MLLRGLLFAVVFVGSAAGLHYYIGFRLIHGAGLTGAAAKVAWAVLALLFLSMPASFAATRSMSRRWALALYWVAHLWMGTFALLLTAVASAELVLALVRALVGPEAGSLSHLPLLVLGLVAPALAVGLLTARGSPKVERVEVPIKGLGEGLTGMTVVQLSDLHIGETLDRRFLSHVVEKANALGADLVAVTGDLIDGTVQNLRDELAPLAKLRAPLGVYYVTGNHEYYHGGAVWEAQVRRLGLTVLHNEHRVVEKNGARLVVAGVTDYEGKNFGALNACRPDLALEGAPAGVPRLLLAHQPRTARLASGLGVDLQLSGHTHGGQIFPWNFLVRLQQPVISGFKVLYGVPVYTSRGTGYWGPPIRLGPAPEITLVKLSSAASP